ncbi:MAG: hypothetical protein QM526_01535 [Alphaproteobacteria bacterium]|nr:hypothetical protein [Alphaproteobacteria bacterium]
MHTKNNSMRLTVIIDGVQHVFVIPQGVDVTFEFKNSPNNPMIPARRMAYIEKREKAINTFLDQVTKQMKRKKK